MAFYVSPFLSVWHGEARIQAESHNNMNLRSSKFGDAREDGKGGEKVLGTIEQQKSNRKIFMDLLVNSMKHLRRK